MTRMMFYNLDGSSFAREVGDLGHTYIVPLYDRFRPMTPERRQLNARREYELMRDDEGKFFYVEMWPVRT